MERSKRFQKVVVPKSERLRQYIISINILDDAVTTQGVSYFAFPQNGITVGFLKDARVEIQGNRITIERSTEPICPAILMGKFLNPMMISYAEYLPKVSIHFREGCVGHFFLQYFKQYAPEDAQVYQVEDFSLDPSKLFDGDTARSLSYLENYLLSILSPVDSSAVEQVIASITDDPNVSNTYLATNANLSERTMSRHFQQYVGCKISEFRRLIRFRKATSTFFSEGHNKLLDLTYENGFYDPSHFHREVSRFTGMSPVEFYKQVRKLGLENHIYIVH